MAYRVIIRGGPGKQGGPKINTAVRQMEDMLTKQFNTIWKTHINELEEVAEQIEADAHYLVPKETGRLDSSIKVYVTKSKRYPGIIASAYANSGGKPGPNGYAGFDYALIQEVNEDYAHGDPTESAHYLAGPFVINIANLYREITGEKLKINKDLVHAALYVKDKI